MNITGVLALLPLFVVLAHSFSWDIVVGKLGKRLEFYYNGTVTHTEHIPWGHSLTAVTYDPVHYRVLFNDYDIKAKLLSIYSFNLTTRKMQSLVRERQTRIDYYKLLAYDPVTQLLLWTEDKIIYSLSLKPASRNTAVDGNLIVTSHGYCTAIAVDSCGGFIYWATSSYIERAALDGSEREVLIEARVNLRWSLVIDHQTQTMYWIDKTTSEQYLIESADLNGKNRRLFYFIGRELWANSLTVSKDFIYWISHTQGTILHLPKHNQHGVAPVVYNSQSSSNCYTCQVTAANYAIEEQTLGNKSCEALKSLKLDVEEYHASMCHNYCFQGNCSVSDEEPKCSCNRGYSGERCEVDACHKHCFNDGVCSLNEAEKPVCQCTAGYQGERCDVSICNDYCLQGNCTVSTERQRTCRCYAGYSGERCEVNACHSYCLNNGECSLNEEDEPVCQCTADYEGERCDVATTHTDVCVCADKMTQQFLQNLRSEVKQVVREELQCVTPLG